MSKKLKQIVNGKDEKHNETVRKPAEVSECVTEQPHAADDLSVFICPAIRCKNVKFYLCKKETAHKIKYYGTNNRRAYSTKHLGMQEQPAEEWKRKKKIKNKRTNYGGYNKSEESNNEARYAAQESGKMVGRIRH